MLGGDAGAAAALIQRPEVRGSRPAGLPPAIPSVRTTAWRRRHRFDSRFAGEWRRAGQHLVKQGACGEDVGKASTCSPRTCSGAMCPGVPTTECTSFGQIVTSAGPASRASPKSSSVTRPSRVSMTFLRLDVPMRHPAPCAAPIASAIRAPISVTLRSGVDPEPLRTVGASDAVGAPTLQRLNVRRSRRRCRRAWFLRGRITRDSAGTCCTADHCI